MSKQNDDEMKALLHGLKTFADRCINIQNDSADFLMHHPIPETVLENVQTVGHLAEAVHYAVLEFNAKALELRDER